MAGRKAQGNKARESYFKNYQAEDRAQKNKARKYAARMRKLERKGHTVKFKTLEEQQAHCRKVCKNNPSKRAA